MVSLDALGQRLRAEGEDVHILATHGRSGIPHSTFDTATLHGPPVTGPGPAAAILATHRPRLLIWFGNQLIPGLLSESDGAGLPRILCDVTNAPVRLDSRLHWLPGRTRAVLQRFERVMVVDENAAQRAQQTGAAPERIHVTGALSEPPPAPRCNEADRQALAAHLSGRPVWFGAAVTRAELPLLMSAHKEALRRSHRLLLVVLPADPGETEAMETIIREAWLEAARQDNSGAPTEQAQVYLVDDPDDVGLWYRLAPIAFIGGTLADGARRSPLEAAMLGSAILHGPATAPHAAEFARLGGRGASRAVRSAASLGREVETLLAPDIAAGLAHAAWMTMSDGAEASNMLADTICANLDDGRA